MMETRETRRDASLGISWPRWRLWKLLESEMYESVALSEGAFRTPFSKRDSKWNRSEIFLKDSRFESFRTADSVARRSKFEDVGGNSRDLRYTCLEHDTRTSSMLSKAGPSTESGQGALAREDTIPRAHTNARSKGSLSFNDDSPDRFPTYIGDRAHKRHEKRVRGSFRNTRDRDSKS